MCITIYICTVYQSRASSCLLFLEHVRDGNLATTFLSLTVPSIDVRVYGFAKFLFTPAHGHSSNLTHNRSFWKRPIVESKHPTYARVGIRVATVERIRIIQSHQDSPRLSRIAKPFDDFFTPIHSRVVVRLTRDAQFILRGIP